MVTIMIFLEIEASEPNTYTVKLVMLTGVIFNFLQTNLIKNRGKFPFTTKSGSVWYLAFVMLSLKFVNKTCGTVARQLFKYW